MKADDHWWIQGYARFPEFLQNFSEHQILWSLCSVVFHALTLKLPIQTSLSVAPKLPVSLSSGEKSEKFMKTSTTQGVALGKHALLLCSISFIFMQFSAKGCQIIRFCPKLRIGVPRLGNYGSTIDDSYCGRQKSTSAILN